MRPSTIKPGDRFGRLTVISFSHRHLGAKYWQVLCECGTAKSVRASKLRSEEIVSCCCQVAERPRQRALLLRSKDVEPEPIPGCRFIRLGKMRFAVVDDTDYEALSIHTWGLRIKNGKEYVGRTVRMGDGKKHTITLHEAIVGKVEGMEIDHRDSDGLNNRRCNLRHCTHKQNQANVRPRRGTKSGFKGVFFDKLNRRWRAVIAGKHIGLFATPEEAHAAYCAVAIEQFGDFARIE